MATIEALPILVIFLVLVSYGLGYWGAIHTAIIHSIAARQYAFETFRQRSNVVYFRTDARGHGTPRHFQNIQVRYHAINVEPPNTNSTNFQSTGRVIAIGRPTTKGAATTEQHVTNIFGIRGRNQNIEVNPIWVMVGYGLCINATCGEAPP